MSNAVALRPGRGDGAVTGRVLLVSFHFGPNCDTGGFRWTGFTDDLVGLGWRFDVITAGNPLLEGDAAVLDRLYHDGAVEVFQIPQDWWGQRLRLGARRLAERLFPAPSASTEPGEAPAGAPPRRPLSGPLFDRLVQHATGVTMLMRDLAWVRRAVPLARVLARTRRYDAVVVTSPRHLAHLAGAEVADTAGVPYVADYRDPWYFGRGADLARIDPVTRWVWRWAERYALQRATLAVDISERAQRAARTAVEDLGIDLPRHYIPNGYAPGPAHAPDPTCFRIAHTGTLYPFAPLDAVFAACRRFRARHGLTPSSLQLEFMGGPERWKGLTLPHYARRYGLDGHVSWRPRGSRAEAEAVQQRASVMLAFDSVVIGALCIPSKLYHYARLRGALLLVGDPAGAMAEEAAKIGQAVVAPDDAAGLDAVLDAAFRRWQQGGFTHRIDQQGVFDARRSSATMHRLLASLRTSAAPELHASPSPS